MEFLKKRDKQKAIELIKWANSVEDALRQMIEKVFSIPGIGKLAVDAMSNRDLPLLEGTVMYIAFVFVIVNLIVDLSYAFLDPRIRYGKGAA